MYAHFIVATFS